MNEDDFINRLTVDKYCTTVREALNYLKAFKRQEVGSSRDINGHVEFRHHYKIPSSFYISSTNQYIPSYTKFTIVVSTHKNVYIEIVDE